MPMKSKGKEVSSGAKPAVHRVTLKDIARETGYTVNTVSHALNDKDDISDAAKDVIRRAAERLGYIGDSMAGSLRTGVTKTVAVIIGDVSNPHFAILVREIDAAAAEQGYCTVILNTDENPEKEKSAIKTAVGRRVDGIIICPTQKDDENTRLLQRCGVPYCFVGRHDGGISCSVVTDDRMGGKVAAENLLSHGKKRFLYIGGDERISSERERREGFLSALIGRGVADCDIFVRSAADMGGIGEVIDGVLPEIGCGRSVEEKLGVLAFSDIYAFEAKRCFSEHGMGNVEVMGFDNIGRTLPFLPRIESIEPIESLGRAAFLMFSSLVSGDLSPSRRCVVIPTAIGSYFLERK